MLGRARALLSPVRLYAANQLGRHGRPIGLRDSPLITYTKQQPFRSGRQLASTASRMSAKDALWNAKPFALVEGFFYGLWSRSWNMMTSKVAIPFPLAFFCGCCTMQYYLGSSDDFFSGSFVTTKDLDALAEFYQAEDLLKIIAIHPIFFELFMNKVNPEENEITEQTALLNVDETKFHVRGLGMEVSFEIIQQEEEIDGESKPVSFQRHERFVDWFPLLNELGIKVMLWDQTWTYGFKRRDDGKVEVFHHGEKFVGPWPIRLIVFFHQYYVLWACEKHINGEAFGTEDLDACQEELAFMPLHVFKSFINQLEVEKQKSLDALLNAPKQDAAAIAKASETVDKLKKLQRSQTSTISVARRQGSTGSMAAASSVKMVAGDSETQEALSAAMHDLSKQGKDSAVNAAVMEVMKNPELEYTTRHIRKASAKSKNNNNYAASTIVAARDENGGRVGVFVPLKDMKPTQVHREAVERGQFSTAAA